MTRAKTTRFFAALFPILMLALPTATADPFWISYEADDYPEDVGWTRIWGDDWGGEQGNVLRSLRESVLTLNTTEGELLHDVNRYDQIMNLQPGEAFSAAWRVKVEPESDPDNNVGMFVAGDYGFGYTQILHGPDSIRLEPGGLVVPVEPGLYHEYTFTTFDFETYILTVDHLYDYTGSFNDMTTHWSYLAFGDVAWGTGSISHWDYVRFGIVPEPATLLLLLLAALTKAPRHRA